MKAKEECRDLVTKIQEFDKQVLEMDRAVKAAKEEVDKLLPKIGNIVDDSVPVSQDEEADTEVVRTWGTPVTGDDLLHHHDLLWRIGGFEPERGSAVAGHRGYFLRDAGLLLNMALVNYGVSFLRARKYSVLQPPYFMNRDVMAGVAQLEQFDEELYKVTGDDEKYLIATSEQPLCGFHKGEWLEEKTLPLRYGGVSTCFRKEAGAHGKDCWGIFRVHQFDKVEQFVVCEGDLEASQKMQEEMIIAAEDFYQSLGIAYRVVNIVSGELNNAAIKKFDLEGWFPGYDAYRELVSCSNCTDYQSRSMEIRCGTKKVGQEGKKYVHMLNSTLCACTRTICAILENFQVKDGIRVPEVLVPFMGGLTFLPFVREGRKDAATAKAADKKPKKTAAPKGMAPAVGKAQNGTGTPSETEELANAIAAKGEEIRQLKLKKADKATVQPHVETLLSLKRDYKAATGEEYAAPSAGQAQNPKPAVRALNPPPLPSTGNAGEGAGVEEAITAKGEEIRALKARKADKETLGPHIAELLNLKAKYKALTGADFVAPSAGSTSVHDKKVAASQTSPKVVSTSIPSTKNKTGTNKAEHVAGRNSGAIEDVQGPILDATGKPILANLNTYLQTRSYIRGFVPSQEDNVVAVAVISMEKDGVDKVRYPHLSRWLRHVGAVSSAERMAWQA
ncbi:seryl-trna synthetase [Nannochloropsis gaditana]|uniref:serine--tRNA ligase n=1 Tax=Nannochloropsis gaditana TaxID=72520 RepID=W7T7G7_9STRA|nr:seryl-trna synthetase [Nannochloropsis gaditana]